MNIYQIKQISEDIINRADAANNDGYRNIEKLVREFSSSANRFVKKGMPARQVKQLAPNNSLQRAAELWTLGARSRISQCPK